MNKLLDRLSYKYRRFGITNLMLYIVVAIAGVFIVELFVPELPLSLYLYFNRDLIFSGQLWRVITWMFIPNDNSPILIIFSLYFYWFMGSGLEAKWGKFKFNVYFFTGALLTIIGGFITGFTTNVYLYYSMFFAFAVIYPDFQLMLFFIIPIKIKWLALIDLAFFVYMMIFSIVSGSFSHLAAIIISMLNFILFFYDDFRKFIKNQIYYFKHRQNYKNNRYH